MMGERTMAEDKQEIERVRAALDAAEAALANALDVRAQAVRAFAALKAGSPEAYLTLPRDNEVIGRMLERVQVFPKDAVRSVMTEIISACNQLTAPLEIVYVGQEGGFGHLAARKHFGSSATLH